MLSPQAKSQKGVRNAKLRFYGADSPEFEAADLAFRQITTEERIAELLASAPPLTDAQRDRLAPLLRGAAA